MNLRTRIATAATVSLFALSLVVGVSAQNTVDQQITGGSGVLTAVFTAATLSPRPFSNSTQTSTGTLNLVVEDSRGTNAGWNVSVIAAAFLPVAPTTGPAIGTAGFTYVTPHSAVIAVTGVTTGVSNAGATGSLVGAHVPLNAQIGSGTGDYIAPLNVALDIPAAQPIGTYRSILTVTIATGPV